MIAGPALARLRRSWLGERVARVEAIGATTVIVVSLVVIAFVGCWNAMRYPIALGYDYRANVDYMHVLLDQHRLPTEEETAEANQPPLYYLVGGLAARAGNLFGWYEEPSTDLPEHTYRGAKLLNVGFVLLTALLLLSLARLALPRSPAAWAAALGFFAFLPVVSKTAAMVHPEPMNMFLSTLALWLSAKLLGGPFRRRLLLLLVVALVAGLATRASAVFTAAAVVVALAVDYLPRIDPRRAARHAPVVAVVAVAFVAVAFWVHRGAHIGTLANLFTAGTSIDRSHFFDLPLEAMFSTPFRSHFATAGFAVTYTEIWGDWIGALAWSPFMGSPTGKTLAVLKDQSWIGVLPTLLALAGYALLAYRVVRRRRDLLAVVLVPPIALAGYFTRSYQQLTPDGDVFKASYVLTTAPIWALGFGIAFDRLRRFRIVQVGLACAFVVFAVMELRFMLYGLRDGNPPF